MKKLREKREKPPQVCCERGCAASTGEDTPLVDPPINDEEEKIEIVIEGEPESQGCLKVVSLREAEEEEDDEVRNNSEFIANGKKK